ncbi:hypothetical protein [Rhodopirellula sallentina]|uniref:Secreted protein n=1 Tax=Rhodopirellula sallentina SM41 TaxID=1263870 RepID=M5UG42_9BACT|nr:hypothetical protein [Rhodopirellula sallentina]EMI56806.1 secreted protein [Rhodopirellula sallentina SM41]
MLAIYLRARVLVSAVLLLLAFCGCGSEQNTVIEPSQGYVPTAQEQQTLARKKEALQDNDRSQQR